MIYDMKINHDIRIYRNKLLKKCMNKRGHYVNCIFHIPVEETCLKS